MPTRNHTSNQATPPVKLRLLVEAPTGTRETKEFSAGRICVGRHESCDLVLVHETVSKKHAEFVRGPDGYTLRDLESSNGTYVNGNWVAETPLAQGDRIRVGRFTLVVLGAASPGPDRTTPSRRQSTAPVAAAEQSAASDDAPDSAQPAHTSPQTSYRTALTVLLAAVGVLTVTVITLCIALLTGNDSNDTATQTPGKTPQQITTPSKGGDGAAPTTAGGRPRCVLPREEVPPEDEIRLRRLFLEILGRPPTSWELRTYTTMSIADTVSSLTTREEHSAFVRAGGVLPDPAGNEDPAAFLTAYYERRLALWSRKTKTTRQLAASLLVNLQDAVPDSEDIDTLEQALGATGGDTLPVAAFLAGEVAVDRDRAEWIRRAYLQFLLRLPEESEVLEAVPMVTDTTGARAFLLALTSGEEYRVY